MKKTLIALALVVAAGVLGYLRFVGSRGALQAQRAAVGASWSTVDAALRDFADLLPPLAAKVKMPEKLKAQAQQTISAARDDLGRACPAREKIEAYNRLSRETARLLLAADTDARLHEDQAFRQLKDELADTDNRILVARRKYNEALERYNASLSLFPNNVVAAISGFSRDDAYFPTVPDTRASDKE